MLNATERREQESLCRLTEADDTLRGRMSPRTRASFRHLTWPLWCHLCWPACPPYSPSWRRRPGWSRRTPPGGGDKENTQPDIRRHVVQEQSGKGQVCHKSRHEGGGATDTLTWHITDRKKGNKSNRWAVLFRHLHDGEKRKVCEKRQIKLFPFCGLPDSEDLVKGRSPAT